MIQSPKAHFLSQTDLAKAHASVVLTDNFQKALEAALLEYSSKCANEQIPMEGHLKHKGAFEFARLLCTLHVPPQQSPPYVNDNLE